MAADNKKIRLDISSTALDNASDPQEFLREALELVQGTDVEIGIQVHNTATEAELDKIITYGVPLSFHAPVTGEYLMNLATENCGVIWEMIARQAELMKHYKVDRAVFHGFRMTDLVTQAFGVDKTYFECMQPAERDELKLAPDSYFVCDFTHLPEFARRQEILKGNLRKLRTLYPEILWCVENDFPAYGSGNLRGQDLAALDHPVCLDTGHLWAASKILDVDFYKEMELALASGNVKMIHLHASKHKFSQPHNQWGDGHLSLDHPTDMDLRRIVQSCKRAEVPHFVLEIHHSSVNDIKNFMKLYY